MNQTPITPTCVGIIMDGNRRYAKERGLPQIAGHQLGYAKLKEVGAWAKESGIQYLILYAFSTENWNRAPEEVSYLLEIFRTILFSEAEAMQKDNVAIRCIGEISRFGIEMEAKIHDIESHNPPNPSHTIVLALSYGGRQEILSAVNALLASGAQGPISQEEFSDHLWTRGIPDPDIIIRVGGEKRLSNFLSWQSTYSELFFVDSFWPAFTKEEFLKIISEYGTRERRLGK